MGVGIEVDFTGETEKLERLDWSNAGWTNAAIEESCSVLAREQPPSYEEISAWDIVERLAMDSGTKTKAYLLGKTVLFSAVPPIEGQTEQLTVFNARHGSKGTPVVSYHFEVPYRADYTVPRYILEQIKAQTPQDAGEPVWPKSVKDLLWSTWRWVDEVHNRMPSGLGYRTSVSIPEPSDRLGYGWITALLLSRSFNTLSPDELPKPAELLPLNDNLVARIARNALYAEVHYDGKTFLRDNTTRSAAAHNPRYGVADPLARYDLGPIRHCILRRPSALGKMRLALHPSSLQKYPALMLKRELRSLGNAYPWELPEEQQLVDLASPAGQIVMTVAREHLAPQIQLAQRAQVKAAKTMIDFAQSILPADAV